MMNKVISIRLASIALFLTAISGCEYSKNVDSFKSICTDAERLGEDKIYKNSNIEDIISRLDKLTSKASTPPCTAQFFKDKFSSKNNFNIHSCYKKKLIELDISYEECSYLQKILDPKTHDQ